MLVVSFNKNIKTICNHFLGDCTWNKDKNSYLKHERKILKNLRIITKNSNPNIGYKNVDTTIRNFHIHNEFHNHKNTNKYLDYNWTKVIQNNKIEHHLQISIKIIATISKQ